MADRIGQQIGNYRLVRLLGSGGFADVYLGKHVFLLNRYAAIKVLHDRLLGKFGALFLKEAQTIADMGHPHIVHIQDFGIDTTPYLVMEYAKKGTVRDLYPTGAIVPLERIIYYAKQIADALQYAHDKQQLIHRDVKPQNFLIRDNDEVLLSDFGIAAVVQNTISLKTQGYAGTVFYSAPEQIRGKAVVASDQYALAVVVYEWLCGHVPFEGMSQIEISMKQINDPPQPLSQRVQISAELEAVVMKALAKYPENRFSSVSEFAKALEAAASSRGRGAGNRSPVPPPQGSKSWRDWLDEGDVHSDAGRYEEAVKAYTEGMKLKKDDTLYNNRGLAYTNLKNYKAAIADFNVAVTLNPSLTAAYYNRGFAYSENKEYVNAIADFSSVIDSLSGTSKADSLLIQAYNSRGLAYYNLGSYSSEAVKDFKTVIARDNRFALAYFHLGLVYAAKSNLQDFNAAIENFTKALDIDSNLKFVYKQRGHAYNELKQYEKAIADFSRAINFDANDAMLYNNRGVAYLGLGKLGDKQKALADYEHALRINPKFVIALENKKRLLSSM